VAGEAETQRYFETLRDTTRYHLDGNQLRLQTDDGRILLLTQRGDDIVGAINPDVIGTLWRLESMDGSVLPEDVVITFGFWLESRVVCNSYNVTVTMMADGVLSIDIGAITTQGCETASLTLEEYNHLTERYLQTLGHVGEYQVDGDRLRLTTADGRELVFIMTGDNAPP